MNKAAQDLAWTRTRLDSKRTGPILYVVKGAKVEMGDACVLGYPPLPKRRDVSRSRGKVPKRPGPIKN